MKKIIFFGVFSVSLFSAIAGEITTGRSFQKFPSGGKLKAETSFKIDADEKRVVVTVDCIEPDVAKLRASTGKNWRGSDSVELFLSPDGTVQNYYQFIIPYRGEERDAYFFAEKGLVKPDPYGPDWTGISEDTANGWRATFTIPLSSFYMTRNHQWRNEWLVNVTRNNKVQGESSTWAHMHKKFHEPENFNKVSGFPKRLAKDDVAIEFASADITGCKDGTYVGTLRISAIAAVPDEFELFTPNSDASVRGKLKSSAQKLTIPAGFPATGRNLTKLSLRRLKTGETYSRYFPVPIVYEPLRIKLTTPEYRDNFYPGQPTTHIEGRVESSEDGMIELSLSGDGILSQTKKLTSSGAFRFDVPDFRSGTIMLKAKIGENEIVRPIRKIEPNGKRMSWISKGNLIVDGKPVFRRNMYAPTYACSAAHLERYQNDSELHLTTDIVEGGTFEPQRLIPGIEAREAKKDVVPCKELLEKVEKIIEASRGKDFTHWYITDEPCMRGLSEIYFKHLYDFVRERDPYHVILTASREPVRYQDCADWFEVHPYLDPYKDGDGRRVYQMPMHRFGQYVDKLMSQNRADKCVGFVPSCFTYKFNNPNSDYPDFDEYRCHVWSALIAGAKTLYPFLAAGMAERPSLYSGTACVFASCDVLSDYLLFGERTPLVKSDASGASLWTYKGEKLLVVVNFLKEPQNVTVPGVCGKLREFRGNRKFVADGKLSLQLNPFEVVIATTDAIGTDLPSISVERKRWMREESARVNRGNQLFEREADIEVATCKKGAWGRNWFLLFNGMHEDLCWTANGKDKWIELSFPKFVPEFREVRVFGTGLDGMVVKVMKHRKWVELKPANVKQEKYSLVYKFAKNVRTIKMRFEFPKSGRVELCEIELPVTGASGAAKSKAKIAQDGGILYEAPDKELNLISTNNMKLLTKKIPIDPEHPWVTFRLEDAKWITNTNWGYHAWNSSFILPENGGTIGGDVINPQKGIYVQKLSVTNATFGSWQRVGYNFDLYFAYMRVCAAPAHRLEVTAVNGKKEVKIGDVVEFRLSLDVPCEDVTCRLVVQKPGPSPFKVNGSDSITLEPCDDSGRNWCAKVKIESSQSAKPFSVRAKCVLLGGATTVPVITTIPFGFTGG